MRLNGEYTVIKNVIREGDVVFDVGANIGDWSKIVTECKRPALIYAFEPVAPVFALLKSNSNPDLIRSYNLGFSNQAAQKTGRTLDETGLSSLYFRHVLQQNLHCVPQELIVTT